MPDRAPTPAETAWRLGKLSARATQVGVKAAAKTTLDAVRNGPDPARLASPLTQLAVGMATQPQDVWRRNLQLWSDSVKLWQYGAARMMGLNPDPVVTPKKGDRRFKHPGWASSAPHDLVKQAYLMMSEHLLGTIDQLGDMSDADRERLAFHTRQHISALSPSNFAATHPAVVEATIAEKGDNLIRGFEALVDDAVAHMSAFAYGALNKERWRMQSATRELREVLEEAYQLGKDDV